MHWATQKVHSGFTVTCYVCLLSCVQLFGTPWAAACQTPLSMSFPRQEHWSGSIPLLQGIFPTQGLNPGLLHLLHWQADSLPQCHLGSPRCYGKIQTNFLANLVNDDFPQYYMENFCTYKSALLLHSFKSKRRRVLGRWQSQKHQEFTSSTRQLCWQNLSDVTALKLWSLFEDFVTPRRSLHW